MRKLTLFALLLIACSSGPEKNLEKAEALIEKERFRDAVAVLQKLEEQKPTPKVYYLLGLCYARMKDMVRVERYFDLALAGDSAYRSEVIGTYILLGEEYFRSSQPDLATHAFEEVLELSPYTDLQEYFYAMGDYYYKKENYDKAIDYYRRGLLFVSDSKRAVQAKRNIVQSYYSLGKNLDAFELCVQFLKEDRDEDLLYQKGTIAYELALESFEDKDVARCMDYLNKVIEAGHPVPLQDDAHFLMGEINLELGEYERAKANFESVLRLNPYGGSQLVRDAQERLRLIEQKEGNE